MFARRLCQLLPGRRHKKTKEQMKTLSKITLAAAALALLGIAAALAHGDKGKHSETRWKTLVIDLAEDARTAFPPYPPVPSTPKRGDTFIINGKLYPGGTLPAGD